MLNTLETFQEGHNERVVCGIIGKIQDTFWAVSIVVVQCIRIARTGVRFPHGPPSINLSDRQSKLAHQYKRLDTLKGKYESR